MSERIEAIVRGRVQLVMYRDYATRKARRLRLTGEVENLVDGTVRVVAEGPRDTLVRYIQKLERGSFLSRVDSVGVSWLPATGSFTTFSIRYA